MKVRALDKILGTRARNCLYNYHSTVDSDGWTEDQWKEYVRSHTASEMLRTPELGWTTFHELREWLGGDWGNEHEKRRHLKQERLRRKKLRDALLDHPELHRLDKEIAELNTKLKARYRMRKMLRKILTSRETSSDRSAA